MAKCGNTRRRNACKHQSEETQQNNVMQHSAAMHVRKKMQGNETRHQEAWQSKASAVKHPKGVSMLMKTDHNTPKVFAAAEDSCGKVQTKAFHPRNVQKSLRRSQYCQRHH